MTQMQITPYPRPRLGHWFAGRGAFGPILDGYTSLHACGRAAIYWAFRGLQRWRESTVWMPAYHCGVEVQAVLDAGLHVDFYRIQPNLAIDVEDLAGKFRMRPGPVLVIHYYGFAQPDVAAVDAMCREFGMPWVEDCAHALFSTDGGRALGSLAPLAVFSLHKTLPLYDGGALQVDFGRLPDAGWASPPPGRFSALPYRYYARGAVTRVAGNWPLDLYRRMRGTARVVQTDWSEEFQERESYEARLAGVSRRVAASANPAVVAERRRSNWLTLDALLAGSPGYCKAFDLLPDGTCPLFLAIRVSEREALRALLQEKGIGSFVFGKWAHARLPKTQFPETALLRDTILCLPVHQELHAQHMERIAAALRPLLQRWAPLPG
jgi:perosamine synthetase